ncbi:MAG: hypothetical protein ACTSXW_08005 [Candidatus Baldrarchaeia archaeon]
MSKDNIETKSMETMRSIKFSEISPKDIFMLSYLAVSQLNVKILKIAGKFKKSELTFKILKDKEIPVSLLIDGESKQIIITCRYKDKEINKINNILQNIKSKILQLIENFTKLNEGDRKEIREIFKVIKEIDRTATSLLNQDNLEKIYFLLSLLRERACNYGKNLIEISIKSARWLNILNNLRKERAVQLSTKITENLLLDLSNWKEELYKRLKI